MVSKWDNRTYSSFKMVTVLSIWHQDWRGPPLYACCTQKLLIWLNPLSNPGHYLLSSLGFTIALQKAALNDRAYDCQALPSLKLGGKGEEPGVLHMKIFV